MGYSLNINGDFSKAYKEVNASYKDLNAVCNAIRYLEAGKALEVLQDIVLMNRAVPYKRFNKHMGARHELGGRKGAYPVKAAKEAMAVLQNAMANAKNKNHVSPESMFIIHASATKGRIERRYPSKGSLFWGRGMYGRSSAMHSDLEYAMVEIALAEGDEPELTERMKYYIKKRNATQRAESAQRAGKVPAQKNAAKEPKKEVAEKAEAQKKNEANNVNKNKSSG
ncbi:MAG: 50S ribosomal protein L22 [Candidatus Micrarchaeia archaeon]